MSRKVFEYFFDPEDLEPFYSELPQSPVESRGGGEKRTITFERRADQAESTLTGCADEIARESLPTSTAPTQSDQSLASRATESRTERASDSAEMAVSAKTPSEESETTSQTVEAIESHRTRVRRLISVHALGQYVFCARSAILAAESGDQRDVDEPMPRFTYLPNFDREQIEEMLSAKITQLGFFMLYGVCLVVLMKMGLAEQNRWVFYPSLVAFLGLAFWSLGIIVCILDLALRRRAAIRAEAREPEPTITQIERVNWWSMLKAGFEPVRYQQPFQHPELPLEGAPWRVLQRDSRRIPVIKSGSHELGAKRGQLYPKHQVRLVAYALLLEATSHIEVPYGLVFPVDSPHGLAFPITHELRERCARLLAEFDHKLSQSQHDNIHPALPENRNRCSRCSYGKPVPTSAKEIENTCKTGQQLVVLQHHSGQLYRCDCADRFGSAPPHAQTVKKGLTAVVN